MMHEPLTSVLCKWGTTSNPQLHASISISSSVTNNIQRQNKQRTLIYKLYFGHPQTKNKIPHKAVIRYMAFNSIFMIQVDSRQTKIEIIAGNGNTDELISLLGTNYTQLEIDTALENAIAYSKIDTPKYLLSLGADLSNYDYQGLYYAVHNNESEGLKFGISTSCRRLFFYGLG